MVSKDFEHTVHFFEIQDQTGSFFLPLVQVNLIGPQQNRIQLSLIFDTGADITSLRSDLYPLLGLTAWDVGTRRTMTGASGSFDAYEYPATLEVFGKIINCPIQLIPMAHNPVYHGLLGRNAIFQEFGFGFWESSHDLYVTLNPNTPVP